MTEAKLSPSRSLVEQMTNKDVEDARAALKSLMAEMVNVGRSIGSPEAEVSQVEKEVPACIDALCDLALKGLSASSEKRMPAPLDSTIKAAESMAATGATATHVIELFRALAAEQRACDRLRSDVASTERSGWIACSDRMPGDETPALIIRNGEIRIGELRWEKPSFEETFQAFRYWDDPQDDGQAWEHHEITHWQPLPAFPSSLASSAKESK